MIAITMYALLKSGGTCCAWFDTTKTEIDDDLIKEFYQKFPEIEKINTIRISSDQRNKLGLYDLLDFKKIVQDKVNKMKEIGVLIEIFQGIIDNVKVYEDKNVGEKEYYKRLREIVEDTFPEEYDETLSDEEVENLYDYVLENDSDEEVHYYIETLQ